MQDITDVAKRLVQHNKGKITEVYFVACGGSLVDMYVSDYFIRSESTTITSGWYTANEFVHATPKRLGKNSVVIACSHGGNTPETVEAARIAKAAGAQTVGLTYNEKADLLAVSDYSFLYEWGDETRVHNNPMAIMLELTVGMVNELEGYDHYNTFMEGMKLIDTIVASAEKQVEPRAKAFANAYKDEEMFYVMASGASYGHAYGFSICSLMEMQWLDATAVHTGEFFHGPLEITDENTPFILAMGLGRTRELDERVLKFLKRYAKKIEVVDAKELGLDMIDDSVSEYFNPVLFYSVLSKYRYALSKIHNHDLDVRRYMGKVEY